MGCGSCKSPCCSRGEEISKPSVSSANRILPSTSTSASVSPSPSPILAKQTPPKHKPRQLPEKIPEDFIVVWLNPSADDDPTTQNTEEQLQELVSVVVTFTDPDECHAFINHLEHEKIFLVVSGTTVEQFAPRIQEASQIDSIYCLGSKEEVSNIQINSVPGLVGTFSSPSLLCRGVKAGMQICGHNLVKPVVIQTEPERILFMYDQLFREIILNSEEESLNEFYNFCETYYSSNNKKKGKEYSIRLRREYSKENAIRWYTEEAALYHVINKGLRKRYYETIYGLRGFIRHLHEQIVVELKNTERDVPTLYRGQAMDTAELDRMRNNRGKPTYFATFLSTSANRDTAMDFAKKSVKKDKNKEKREAKVLFEIKVDKNVYFPFADVHKLSDYEEEEWLFSLGSVFRIDTVETIADETELIRLTSINDNDEELTTLKEHFQNFVKDKNICLSFARLIYQLADWEGSRIFYQKSLNAETESYRRAAIYNNLGSIALELEDYDEALKNYRQSLDIERKEENTDYRDLASTYNNIGTVYHKKKEMHLAIENFEYATTTYNDTPNDNLELIATLYNNIAIVLSYQGNHRQALVNNERCLRIRERILPPLHPSLATAYNSIACTYHHLQLLLQNEGYSSEAVEYATKAVNIDRQVLPSDHPQTKVHTENLDRFINAGTNSEQ